MTVGMTFIGATILWGYRPPTNGSFWPDLAGPFFLGGRHGIRIQADLYRRPDRCHQAGRWCGLGPTQHPPNLGSEIGVAITSSIATSQLHRVGPGLPSAAALAGAIQEALLVCGLSALVAVLVAHFILRRSTRPSAGQICRVQNPRPAIAIAAE
jgi:hypothetical protein